MRWRRCLPVTSCKGCRESCREHQVSPSPPRGRGGDKAAEASHRDEREMSPMVVWTVMEPVGLGLRLPEAVAPVFLWVTDTGQAEETRRFPVVVEAVSAALVARGRDRAISPVTV